jgi:hypothetical protein
MIYNIKWLPLYIFDSIFEITDIVVFTTIIMYNKHIYLMENGKRQVSAKHAIYNILDINITVVYSFVKF